MPVLQSFLIVLLLVFPAWAAEIRGKVVAVADGDTLTVLDGTTQVKVRLAGIDAQEKGQAFGNAAKKQLSDRAFNTTAKVVWEKKDRYGRTLGDVFIGDDWINRELVEAGYAWHFVQYSKDERLAEAQTQAREKKAGLWQDREPVPPWDCRKRGRNRTTQ